MKKDRFRNMSCLWRAEKGPRDIAVDELASISDPIKQYLQCGALARPSP